MIKINLILVLPTQQHAVLGNVLYFGSTGRRLALAGRQERVDTVLDIQPFNLEQMGQFLNNWYLQNEIRRQNRDDAGVRQQAAAKAADLKKRILTHPALAAMAVNPLLLTMIATVHDNRGALPGRRVELYGEICDVLLGRRQEAKGLTDILSAAQKQRVLQTLALELDGGQNPLIHAR